RQAIRWLRQVLPDREAVVSGGGRIALAPGMAVSAESTRFEATLARAARLQGDARRAAMLEAVAIHDRGEYLEGARSSWVDERREELGRRASAARYEAAEVAFAAERYDDATTLARQALADDP